MTHQAFSWVHKGLQQPRNPPSKGLADSGNPPPPPQRPASDLGPGKTPTGSRPALDSDCVGSASRTFRSLCLDARQSWKCHRVACGAWLFHLVDLLALLKQQQEEDPCSRTLCGGCGLCAGGHSGARWLSGEGQGPKTGGDVQSGPSQTRRVDAVHV